MALAAYTITALVKVYRNGDDPIDYTGWTEDQAKPTSPDEVNLQ